MFYSPFSIAITSLGDERAGLGAFCTFVRFVLVWICMFPLLLGVWEGLPFVIVALPGLCSYFFSDSLSFAKIIYALTEVLKNLRSHCERYIHAFHKNT